MNVQEKNKYLIFRISWLILLITTVCDYNIADKISLGFFSINIQASSIGIVIYILLFLLTFPMKEIPKVFNSKFDKWNIMFLSLLLIIAYISGYFSVMQKYALVTTSSRYLLYFIAFIITLCYFWYYARTGIFILRSFVYVNLLIALSSIAEYFIPSFYRILVDHFGIMQSKHALMYFGNLAYMRPSGFITDANLTAFTLGLSSILLLLNREKFNKIFLYIFYTIAGLSFGMLASRSALIMVIFLFAAAIVFKKVNWKNALVYFVLFIIIQLITQQTQARFFNITDESRKMDELEHGRPLIWKADYLAMKIKPWIGIGSGVFFKQSDIFIAKAEDRINDETYYNDLNNPDFEMIQGINPHNIFFTMQIEYGVFGTILFTIMVIFNLIYLFRTKNFISLSASLGILFVSSLSNYAPYYKYYLLIIIIYYILMHSDFKLANGVQRS